ncbi:hypothetical protein DFP72DRAFT_852773 [Ephemerocybe angulata]|uniref:Uncharacterized protein n=1 Tax=Ephemerocybe angulata TaxID=980116 RepID=A0A8H6LZX9_9AGAR|nr:hypothetical protein DFP72DRAFT_852773 [Tulosesus angulatus]
MNAGARARLSFLAVRVHIATKAMCQSALRNVRNLRGNQEGIRHGGLAGGWSNAYGVRGSGCATQGKIKRIRRKVKLQSKRVSRQLSGRVMVHTSHQKGATGDYSIEMIPARGEAANMRNG